MYKVAIPSYKREKILLKKSLPTLIEGKVSPNQIYIFVANKSEQKNYEACCKEAGKVGCMIGLIFTMVNVCEERLIK